jgi:hypothetical protein
MKINMKSFRNSLAIVLGIAPIAIPEPSIANTLDCQDLYVGRIWVEQVTGLKGVVFLDHPENSSGSYWVFFDGWTVEDKKSALALLTTAKISQHRVNVSTTESNGCGIQTAGRTASAVFLANRP